MLYRPTKSDLWDTTLIHDGQRFHLFHIAGNGLGHAVSDDLARWEELDSFDLKGPPGSWNEKGAFLTGDIVQHEGVWHLFAGAHVPDSPTLYGLFTSPDLTDWTPHPDNPVLVPEGPHYRTQPSPVHEMHAAWRDPAIYKWSDGQYHALLCARSPHPGADSTGALIGHVCSRDLVHWNHLPPIADVGQRALYAEVPGWFTLNGRHYVYYLDLAWGGTRVHSAAQGDDLCGTFYLWADQFEGPYQKPESPLLIGMRRAHMGPWAARVREHEGKLLFYYHISAARPAFAAPKEVVELSPGQLGLRYLPIMDKLTNGTVVDASKDLPRLQPRPHDPGHWQSDGENILTARALDAGSSAIVADELADGIVEASLTVREGAAAGVVLRASSNDPATPFADNPDRAVAATIDVERQQVALRDVSYVPGHGWGFTWLQARGFQERPILDQVTPYALERGKPYNLRILARGEFIELFINDLWVLSAVAPEPSVGRLECFVERGEATFQNIQVRSLPPLD